MGWLEAHRHRPPRSPVRADASPRSRRSSRDPTQPTMDYTSRGRTSTTAPGARGRNFRAIPTAAARVPQSRASTSVSEVGSQAGTMTSVAPWRLDQDPVLQMNLQVAKTSRRVHVLPASHLANCPTRNCVGITSGAMYKRTEDGIVLVDQDRYHRWRMCVSACPYKKILLQQRRRSAHCATTPSR